MTIMDFNIKRRLINGQSRFRKQSELAEVISLIKTVLFNCWMNSSGILGSVKSGSNDRFALLSELNYIFFANPDH